MTLTAADDRVAEATARVTEMVPHFTATDDGAEWYTGFDNGAEYTVRLAVRLLDGETPVYTVTVQARDRAAYDDETLEPDVAAALVRAGVDFPDLRRLYD